MAFTFNTTNAEATTTPSTSQQPTLSFGGTAQASSSSTSGAPAPTTPSSAPSFAFGGASSTPTPKFGGTATPTPLPSFGAGSNATASTPAAPLPSFGGGANTTAAAPSPLASFGGGANATSSTPTAIPSFGGGANSTAVAPTAVPSFGGGANATAAPTASSTSIAVGGASSAASSAPNQPSSVPQGGSTFTFGAPQASTPVAGTNSTTSSNVPPPAGGKQSEVHFGTASPQVPLSVLNEHMSVRELLYDWQKQLDVDIESFNRLSMQVRDRNDSLNSQLERVLLMEEQLQGILKAQRHVDTAVEKVKHGKHVLDRTVSRLETEVSKYSEFPSSTRDQNQRLEMYDNAMRTDSLLMASSTAVEGMVRTKESINLKHLQHAPADVAMLLDELSGNEHLLETLSDTVLELRSNANCIQTDIANFERKLQSPQI